MKFYDLDIKIPEKKIGKNIKITKTTDSMIKEVQKEYKDKNIDLDQNKIVEAGCLWLKENLKRGLKA